ncbi:MAG: HEAT repeat domain-containing protein, partial [Promethearchaeota archaeon]
MTKLADLVPVVLMFDATEVLKSDTELCHWMEWNLIDPLAKSQVRQVFASRVPMRWRSFHVRRVMSAMILDPLSLQDTARNLVREMLQQHNAHLKSEETEQAIRLVLAFSFGNPLLSEEIAGHVAKRWTMTTTDRLKRDLCKQVVKPFIERCFLGDIEQPWDKIVWWISVLDRFDVAMLRRYLSQVVPILTTDWSVGFILDGLGQMTDLGLVVWQDEGGYRLCGAIEDIVRHCLATLEPERYRRACQAAAQAFETSVHRFSGDAGKYRRRAVVGINDSRVIEPLIAELQHANKDVRRAAVEALREIGIPSVRCLIVALQDKDKDVRGAAAWALGKMDDPQAVDSLIAALRDDEWLVRQAIINALGEIGAPSIDPLTATLQDESKDVRQSAVYALARIGISAVQPLLAALQDKDVEVRWAAARALRQIGDPTATEALIAALRDSDSDVRRIAAQALGQIGGPMVAEPLIAALQDEDVRDAAVEALGRIHALQSAELLTIILQDDKRNVYTRQAAAEALGRIGNPDSVKPLITFLADQDESIRLAAIEALGRIGAPAVRSLITSLRNEDGSMRWAAAKALQEVGDPAVRPLVAVLGDGDVNVRQSAAWALGRLGIPQATEPLKALLQDQELSVRRVAARALEQIRAAEPMASKDYEMARQSVFGRRQPCEPIALHYSDVSFPAQTSIGQVAALRVAITLTPKSEQAAELALEMPPGYTGTMQVDACVSVSPADFDVHGPNIQTIDVSIESDSTPIIFKIAPKSMGRKSIAVEFFQNARYLGRAEVETDVVEEPRTAQDVFAHLSLTVHPHPSAPDLVV